MVIRSPRKLVATTTHSKWLHQVVMRRLLLAAFFGALFGGLGTHSGWAEPNQQQPVCGLAAGLQARIDSIATDRGAQVLVRVERAGKSHVVRSGCLLIAGDLIKPAPGNSAVVILPDGTTTRADFSHPVVVPAVNPPSYLAAVINTIRKLAGADGGQAQKLVNGTTGMRDLDDGPKPVVLQGINGSGPQAVLRDRPLMIAWTGGASPFQIQIVTDTEPARVIVNMTSDVRYATVELSGAHEGVHVLAVTDSDGSLASVKFRLASAADRPVAPEPYLSGTGEARDLVSATWLLTKGPAEWRLETISELRELATEHHNIVAQSFLQPKVQSDR